MADLLDDHFYTNTADNTHCMPACVQIVYGRLTGKRLTLSQAEEMAGYEPGKLTWQFGLLRAFSVDMPYYAIDFERFSADGFVKDPARVIEDQIGDPDAVRYQIENSDLDAEVGRLQDCLNSERTRFIDGIPSLDLIESLVGSGAKVVCLVNAARLRGNPDYDPHFLVVREIEDETFVLDDPGPPPKRSWRVSRDAFAEAWMDPNPGVANLLAISDVPMNVGE